MTVKKIFFSRLPPFPNEKVESHAISISIERLLRASNSIHSSFIRFPPARYEPRFARNCTNIFETAHAASTSARTIKYQGRERKFNEKRITRRREKASDVQADFKKPRFYDRNIRDILEIYTLPVVLDNEFLNVQSISRTFLFIGISR